MPASASLPDPSAITVTGLYRPGSPCHAIELPDGRRVLLPPRVQLVGIPEGGPVTAMGERMEHSAECGGPVLILRGYFVPGN